MHRLKCNPCYRHYKNENYQMTCMCKYLCPICVQFLIILSIDKHHSNIFIPSLTFGCLPLTFRCGISAGSRHQCKSDYYCNSIYFCGLCK